MSDYYWLLFSSALVFLMQAGFLCLESGRIRSKNSINVAAKNMSDFIISTTLFWLFGFGVMFGDSVSGLFGVSDFLFGEEHTPWQISFFLFQMMFCSTAATLTSGAVAERMNFLGYVAVTVILSAVIYPVVGHWVWGGVYQAGGTHGWLESMGFIDFAGSTVVHSVGGWIALVAIIIIGPRIGRFDNDKRLPAGNNLPLSALGVLLIWFGWFGFNGGSTLSLTDDVPLIILNTFISAAWGGLVAVVLSYFRDGFVDVGHMLNGAIAGLVGVTASCHIISPSAAILVGGVSGAVVYYGSLLMVSWKLDDALDVVPAHLFAGAWGTISVALFGQAEKIGNGLSFWEQLGVQLFGVVIIGVYCFVIGFVLLSLCNCFMRLRAKEDEEVMGLNVAEHKATTELLDLLTTMQYQQSNADFSNPVPEEPFTEVGQIAQQYNQVIERVNVEISHREEAITRFKESEIKKSAILNSSMDCIITINRLGEIIEFNPASEKTFGYIKTQVEGKNFLDLFIVEEDKQKIQESLNSGFSTNDLILNRRNRLRLLRSGSNSAFSAEIAITKVNTKSLKLAEYTFHIKDMTKQEKLQDRLRFLAYRDPLTNLYNRTYLMDDLARALLFASEHNTKVGLLFLDLDNFKMINDTLGHKAGDELLCEVAKRLMATSEQQDVIARWGGDEFVVMMTESVSREKAIERGDQILTVMRETFCLAGQYFAIPTSIGIALSDEGIVDADRLIQHADIAMYQAKEKGRDNAQFFTSDMAVAVNKKFGFEGEVLEGLAADNFFLLLQPQVDIDNTKILGLEALIRWDNPSSGIISPAEFIPMAEESDLIISIDEWVIDAVLKQLKAWQDKGLPMVPISINLSGRHLISDGLLSYISQKLNQYNIDGQYLELEITEGVFLKDIERCIEVMADLKGLGVKTSVDDFGTGYSSLSYLKRLPLNTLKIDQSFVQECDLDKEDTKICETIIHLARNLELSIVAEGVETASQASTLKQLGCDVFQGYYYYKPMSIEKIEELLSARK
ncbi:ammonium transporter [Marinomonas sp. C2222]|uniref:Ammonium transporter n=1 Tax=Marinomonas sargassi TaxID=2984494 RepID=A0ABT2YUV8_9GAMM|nr:ammonium transporter [Marinomonas sargassi]MCV2403687.1 ammonium transporter [Marinomonas sargassi]